MNILFALSQVEVTGAEVYAAQLADALIERGHSVLIVSDTFTKPTKAAFIPLPFNQRSWSQRIRNIRALVRIIRERNIHLVHAHSRASGWCAFFAAKITRIPLVTTVHGRQPTHFSRKLVKAFGDLALPICEAVQDNLVRELGVQQRSVRVVRNGVDVDLVPTVKTASMPQPPVITLVGRLSKEKGELAVAILENLLPLLNRRTDVLMRVVGGSGSSNAIPAEFDRFRPRVEFTGYVDNVADYIADSSVVLGAGRSAIESILLEKPTIACGEARLHGRVTMQNLADVLTTNFGDIAGNPHQYDTFDWSRLVSDVEAALREPFDDDSTSTTLRTRIAQEFSLTTLTDRVESDYQTAFALKHRFEIPILTYHRVVRNRAEGGKLPIYVTAEQMESHLQCLQRQGFQTITLRELASLPPHERFPKQCSATRNARRYALLTFDDGYEDNYTVLFPLLKKYGMTATIFLVPGQTHNVWDSHEQSGLPPVPLLNNEQIRAMQEYGIEFGAHSMTHPRLTDIPLDEARREILESKRAVEERIGSGVQSFCYPYGALNEHIKDFVREAGYTFGIASDSGPLFFHEDPYEIRRIGVFPNTHRRGFARKIAGDYLLRKHSV